MLVHQKPQHVPVSRGILSNLVKRLPSLISSARFQLLLLNPVMLGLDLHLLRAQIIPSHWIYPANIGIITVEQEIGISGWVSTELSQSYGGGKACGDVSLPTNSSIRQVTWPRSTERGRLVRFVRCTRSLLIIRGNGQDEMVHPLDKLPPTTCQARHRYRQRGRERIAFEVCFVR